ncbi:MAG TPA: recombinase family protein [Gemmatimonadales bacterium]|jgi:site-specific DNA recombinase
MKQPIRQNEDGGKRVGIWIRVSTEDQAKGESPENHEARARMYATMKGWTIVRVYDLSGVSGKTVKDHSEAKAMLKDIADGSITGLIFSKLARLARNTRELLDFAEYFDTHHADLISLAESIDTSTPAGRFFYTLIAALSQWEREEISERVKASVITRATLGKPLGGAAPFGFRYDEHRRLVPDPKEAPIRHRLFELFLEERRLKTVADKMNTAGHRTRNGGKFSDTTVHRLLTDPIAKGQRRANCTRSLGDGRNWDWKSPDEWIFTQVEAIVSEELWDACNAHLTARRRNVAVPGKKPVHLFVNYAYCECGQRLKVSYKSDKYSCKSCGIKVVMTDLEEVFRDQLRGFLLSPDQVANYLERADATLVERRALAQSMQTDVDALRNEMRKTHRLYLDGELSAKGFGDLYRPLEARVARFDTELPEVQAAADFLSVQLLSSEEMFSGARDLYARWDSLAFEEKRAIVENLVERITVGKDEVTIDLASSPASLSNRSNSATNPQGFIDAIKRKRAG